MGRGPGKLNLELIRDKNIRKITFRTRKASLMKKSSELAALCDIPVCTVVYGGDEEPNSEPEYWPKDVNEVRRIINMYNSKSHRAKTVDLHDFYTIKNKKLEKQIAKVRQQRLLDRVRNIPLDRLNEALGSLDRNMEVLDALIIKAKRNTGGLIQNVEELLPPPPPPPPQRITTNNRSESFPFPSSSSLPYHPQMINQFLYPNDFFCPTVPSSLPLTQIVTNNNMHNIVQF